MPSGDIDRGAKGNHHQHQTNTLSAEISPSPRQRGAVPHTGTSKCGAKCCPNGCYLASDMAPDRLYHTLRLPHHQRLVQGSYYLVDSLTHTVVASEDTYRGCTQIGFGGQRGARTSRNNAPIIRLADNPALEPVTTCPLAESADKKALESVTPRPEACQWTGNAVLQSITRHYDIIGARRQREA